MIPSRTSATNFQIHCSYDLAVRLDELDDHLPGLSIGHYARLKLLHPLGEVSRHLHSFSLRFHCALQFRDSAFNVFDLYSLGRMVQDDVGCPARVDTEVSLHSRRARAGWWPVQRLADYHGHREYLEGWGPTFSAGIYQSPGGDAAYKRVRFEINR